MNCKQHVFLTAAFIITTSLLPAQTSFNLKSAPPDLEVYLNNELIIPFSAAGGVRSYRTAADGMLRFSAEGYNSIEYQSGALPVKNNITGIKLEKERGFAQLLGEYSTGIQPKSAYFSPDGKMIFVPLLGQHGVDVFRVSGEALFYEKRLTVPGGRAAGFVEIMCDEKRREVWVSNMEENKVHIFNLDTLEYKTSASTDGIFPKVITQSPDGKLTAVSNWISMDISVFDSDTKKLLAKIPVGGTPRGMAFSPDSSLLYTAIYDEALVVVINMTQQKIVNRFRLSSGAGAARHVIFYDNKLYVSDMLRGTVNIINAATGNVTNSKYVGLNINTIVLSPCGRYVIASSRGRNHPEDYTRPGPEFGAVYILEAEDLRLVEKIWGRNQPTGLAVSPDGKLLVFTDFLDANLELYRMPAP